MKDNATTAVLPAVEMIRVDRIDPSPLNRRCSDDDEGVLALAASIDEVGLISPIAVRPHGSDRFEIICGERRWRAFRSLGREDIPCIVKEVDDSQAQIERLTENMQREGLSFLEEGDGVAALLEVTNNDYAEVANRLRCEESWVRRRAKLPNLTQAWREELANPETQYSKIRDAATKLEEIAILPPTTQDALLANGFLLCHQNTIKKMREALAKWFMNLDAAPWSRAWVIKLSSSKRCANCTKRSDKELKLFSDLNAAASDKDVVKLCLDPSCWRQRIADWCKYLLQETPDAEILWDGFGSDDDFCVEQYGRAPLRGVEWDEYDEEDEIDPESLIEHGRRKAIGVFVGGARAGVRTHILVNTDAAAEKDDGELRERLETRRAEVEAQQRRGPAIEQQIEKLLPADVQELRTAALAAGIGEFEFMATLLNWACWTGSLGSVRHEDDIRESFDISNTAADSCPGLQYSWQCIRDALGLRIYYHVADGDELDKNDWFAVTTLCEWLGVSLEELGKVGEKEDANAE